MTIYNHELELKISSKSKLEIDIPLPRKQLISLESTPYYHCVSRCVRRAFLCGVDYYTGKDHSYRRKWVEKRLFFLASEFMIDIASYAIMSNHYHAVLRVDLEGTAKLTDCQVINKWHKIFKPTTLTKQYLKNPETLLPTDILKAQQIINEWRKRLTDISWFMRCLNKYIARRANKSDNCTGRFWEYRFKSQALIDNKALLACMAYVDLNPCHAAISNSPTQSRHTAVKKRIKINQLNGKHIAKKVLLPFKKDKFVDKKNIEKALSFTLRDYVKLLEWTLQNIEKGNTPSTNKIQYDAKKFKDINVNLKKQFKTILGTTKDYKTAYRNFKMKKQVGLKSCLYYFDS